MFRTAELGRKVTKEEFAAIAPDLRIEIVDLQQRLRLTDFPTIMVFAGVNGAGKVRTVNLLNEWMDPRWIVTRAYDQPSDEERERPEYWRYWRDMPPKGKIGLFLSSWYSTPVLDRAYDRIDDSTFDARLNRILTFEKLLTDDGALILKFWMHLGKDAQKKRLKSLEKDPHESWRVTKADWDNWHQYDGFITAAEHVIMRTSVAHAPWTLVEGVDSRYRALTVLNTFREAANRHIEARTLHRQMLKGLKEGGPKEQNPTKPVSENPLPAPVVLPLRQPSVLQGLDMNKTISPAAFTPDLQKFRGRLNRLYREAKDRKISTVLVFEGWDAAGKGGTIRRLTSALDARDYMVVPFGPPTDEERAQHYLWRFWRHLSRAGRVTVFDRSWYGRVLVERVEDFANPAEWRRAYAEINDFEDQLVQHGTVVVKYWLHITEDEQEQRFKHRQEIAYKRWKLTEEDWRNRGRWNDYEQAVNDMVEHTSTHVAPWHLIEANDKNYARLTAIKVLCKQLERVLDTKE
ncbi:MAG: polyphosphate:AMP phosphotransferase [Alphaproteobacteria bacterium]|nr:polyphosphate:AMP phosphotransferase [Alphaproteobacteria bacterium]